MESIVDMGASELSVEQMRRVCDPKVFDFTSIEELDTLNEIIGQGRAVRAVSFGIEIESPGYHKYALGPAGAGKTTTIRKFLERKAKKQPVQDDWLYINNFDDPDRPLYLRLPAGQTFSYEEEKGSVPPVKVDDQTPVG